jgi:hypothetical protein
MAASIAATAINEAGSPKRLSKEPLSAQAAATPRICSFPLCCSASADAEPFAGRKIDRENIGA